MLESIINPKSAEKGPWKMFFVGLFYGSLSLILVHFLFSGDPALAKASGMLVVAFCMMFSLPFMYFIIKIEETEDEKVEGLFYIWKVHSDAIFALMWLFLGFLVAFSFWHIILHDNNLLNFQIETYCQINEPRNIQGCVDRYTIGEDIVTGNISSNTTRLVSIIQNNVVVMIFTLLFSLVFGAGAIFVLIWNASVIAAAIGIFANYSVNQIPLGLLRYLIHGVPEIAAYFITALAGGIFGVGVLRNGVKSFKTLRVLENTIILLFLSLIILVLAGLMEVYLTPLFFS